MVKEGFKIDRKVDNENWQTAYGNLSENTNSYISTNVFYKSVRLLMLNILFIRFVKTMSPKKYQ